MDHWNEINTMHGVKEKTKFNEVLSWRQDHIVKQPHPTPMKLLSLSINEWKKTQKY